MSIVTIDTIVDFLRSGGGHVTYSELKHKFSYYLNDPANADANRQNFRELIKKVATFVQQADGERVLTLKEKWRQSGESEKKPHQPLTESNTTSFQLTPLQTSKDSGFSQTSSLACPKSTPRPDSSISSSSEPSSLHKQWLQACCHMDLEKMKRLLSEKPELFDDADSFRGYTAFHWAALTGNCEAIEFLFSRAKSADAINRVTNDGYTPLHLAYMHNRILAAHMLEKLGADITAEDYGCRQPSHYLRQGQLLRNRNYGQTEASANCNIANRDGTSLAGKLASKFRDKVRSLSASSNSSVDSVNSSSSNSGALRRSGHPDGTDSHQSNSNRSSKRIPFIRGLSASSGALDSNEATSRRQFTPHLVASHYNVSRSQEISPLTSRPGGRKSSELMPPPSKFPAVSRV